MHTEISDCCDIRHKASVMRIINSFCKIQQKSGHQEEYQEKWEANIKSEDVLLRYKTRLLMKHAAEGTIEEFDPALMMAVMDHITVYEDGRLQIKFYDGTEFEVATE